MTEEQELDYELCPECGEPITEDSDVSYCAACDVAMHSDCAEIGDDGYEYCSACIEAGEGMDDDEEEED